MNKNFSSHLILNSNRWFSAVSDYSLQLAKYLHAHNTLLYVAHQASPMHKILQKEGINTQALPLWPAHFFNFIKSFLWLHRYLKKENQGQIIWVFEGRENTLCILHKILFPKLWRNKILVRIRGQAKAVKKNIFSQLVYRHFNDKVIFAAECVQKKVPFSLSPEKARVFPYLRDTQISTTRMAELQFSKTCAPLSLTIPTFLLVGRFDPVKAQQQVIDAFLQARFCDKQGNVGKCQLIFVGRSENIKASDLYKTNSKDFSFTYAENNTYFLSSPEKEKSILILDEARSDVYELMRSIHFGIISSLESEVICRVAVEFLQCGKPVLSSMAGALPEVLSDFPQFHYATGNVPALQEKLEQAYALILEGNNYEQVCAQSEALGWERYGLKNFAHCLSWILEEPT